MLLHESLLTTTEDYDNNCILALVVSLVLISACVLLWTSLLIPGDSSRREEGKSLVD